MSQEAMKTVKTEEQEDVLPEAKLVSLRNWGPLPDETGTMSENAVVDCGWGRLVFAQTFSEPQALVDMIKNEKQGRRDIALYLRDPHVLVSLAPQELFLDPSHTFRLALGGFAHKGPAKGSYTIRPFRSDDDIEQITKIYKTRNMVVPDETFFDRREENRIIEFFVAVDNNDGRILGVVQGIDHVAAFKDIDNGSSLWALAVDPQSPHPGVGEALATQLALHFKGQGRAFMDLSVMHDNKEAIALYHKLGFIQIPVYCLKNKNNINEKLYIGPTPADELNIYAGILVDEARRRGISVDVLDAEGGFFALTHGGRTVKCRESLSELTSAVAMSRCDDKSVTRRLLNRHGLRTPDQQVVERKEDALAFLQKYGRVVIKPARGEQGHGVYVDLRTAQDVKDAIGKARRISSSVIVEEFVEGEDLRIIVINGEVVAAAVRRPAHVVGNGRDPIKTLIGKQSRRRAAATGGESKIPLDAETVRCVEQNGYAMEDVLPEGTVMTVRKTANLHTGGTIHDVTADLHPDLVKAAVKAAEILEIPVVGFDFLVPAPDRPEYAIVEANERPGLANHEPQPTAERFIDMLFPETQAKAS